MDQSSLLIIGANGQLGQALQGIFPQAKAVDSEELDITNQEQIESFDWSNTKVILNAAAYTNVDGAETPEGKAVAWKVNDEAVGYLSGAASKHDLLLVHTSTAYVFDGKKPVYTEEDETNPLGEYAKSKAAGDLKAARTPKHYIVRTDSVIGEGKNFVRTMLGLAAKGINPTVVADQVIRPTFTSDLAQAIKFLVENMPDYGIYNVTNEGEPISWADFTREIFKQASLNNTVTDTTYAEYSAGKEGIAPRPLNSVLDLSKIEALGFKPADWRDALKQYLNKELQQ